MKTTTTALIRRDIENDGLRATLRELPELARKRGANLAACEAYAQFYATFAGANKLLSDSEAATLRTLASAVK